MSTEIFRFTSVRPPQEINTIETEKNAIDLNRYKSDFIQLLVEARKPIPGTVADPRALIKNEIERFLKTNVNGFIDSQKKVDARFLLFYKSLGGLEKENFHHTARESFIKIFDTEPNHFLDTSEYEDLFVKVTDSIVIAAIEQNIEPAVRSLLVNLAKILGLIQKLATFQENQDYSKKDFYSQIILLPEGIFPLPNIEQDLSVLLKAEKERLERIAKNQAKLLELSKELMVNRNAIHDLLSTFEKSKSPDPISGNTCGFMLSDQDVSKLHLETRMLLGSMGLDLSKIDISAATSMIEKKIGEISNKLYANRSSMKYMVTIGNNMIPSDVLISEIPAEIEDSEADPGDPGLCPPVLNVEQVDDVTIPLEETHGEIRAKSIGDLMLVEQELLRFELGEIAHIENVLKSEVRARNFRTTTTTETSTLTETETIEEKTQDLSSTERFELQIESENVINENTNIDTGITINASYGPSIDTTAHFNYTNSTAKQKSNRASTQFSRETTSRATNRIQKRTLERQFTKTVNEIEERNKHSFDNTGGPGNITGVYRFVDKVYQAQVINYGKRLMLEFIVPEPAAFLRYAMTKQTINGVTQIKPEPPGYCKNNIFIALEPKHIDRDNYLYWAGKYLAEDIVPPPNIFQIIAGSIATETATASEKSQGPDPHDYYKLLQLSGLNVPPEYKPIKACVTIEGWHIVGTSVHHIALQVQNQFMAGLEEDIHIVSLDLEPTFN